MDILKLINSVNKKTVFELSYEALTIGHLLTISINKNKTKALNSLYKKLNKKFNFENLIATNKPTSPVFGKDRNKSLYILFFSSLEEMVAAINYIGDS